MSTLDFNLPARHSRPPDSHKNKMKSSPLIHIEFRAVEQLLPYKTELRKNAGAVQRSLTHSPFAE
jgi:hypothetical protein